MIINKEIEHVMLKWIGASTWHTDHPCDERRFHYFVKSYQRFNGNHINESELLKILCSHAKLSPNNTTMIELVRRKIRLITNILDFLDSTHG